MEKIININLAGRVISIEDAAYTSLKAYLESLQRYFAGEEGRDEIINDIESRVAELMDEKIKRGASAISEADVQEIIAGMGRVEDFAAEEGADPEAAAVAAAPRVKGSKRFYRDANDKIAGGVCAGIAAYLNVDPALIRVLFAILTLGGWGTGVLLYIVLWIFVPESREGGFTGRRLYRNEDNKWLGGVASGVAAYFGKETWVFRIAFAAPFLLGIVTDGPFHFTPFGSLFFGSISGAFALIYIVLWVVLPLAKTPYQKMEMRGERVDLASIRENVQSEMGDLKARVKDWGGEVQKSASNFYNARGKEFGREVAATARPIASRGGEVIVTIIKAFFFFIGATIAFSLFMALIGYSFGGFADVANDFVLQTTQQRILGWATVILLLGVPLVALVAFITRRALKMKGGSRYLSLGFSLLWVAGIVCAVFLAADVTKEFSRVERVAEEVPILQPRAGRMILDVPGESIEYSNSMPWLHGDIRGWDVNGDTMRSASVGITTKISPDSFYHVIVTRYSNGRTDAAARMRAGKLFYPVQNAFGSDSLLQLASGYVITKAQGYRAQTVGVTIQVPVGKKLRFNESIEDKLVAMHHVRTRHSRRSHGWEIHWDEEDSWDRHRTGVDYVMQANGKLIDPLHPNEDEDDDSYYYDRRGVRRELDDAGAELRRAGDELRNVGRSDREVERQQDSLDHAVNMLEREKERRMDSIDRAINLLERQKERME